MIVLKNDNGKLSNNFTSKEFNCKCNDCEITLVLLTPQINPNSPQINPNSPQINPNSPQINPNSPQINPKYSDSALNIINLYTPNNN
jgi:hypothetical protein